LTVQPNRDMKTLYTNSKIKTSLLICFTFSGDNNQPINNTTGCNGNSVNAYTYLPAPIVTAGNLYPISIVPNSSLTPMYSALFVDWNSDGDYLDTDEFYNLGQHTGNLNSNIAIPINALNGVYTFAVMSTFYNFPVNIPITQSNYCTSSYLFGEFEEYVLEVGQCTGLAGCIDPNYCEYNPNAVCSDGSCLTLATTGCTDPNFCEYNPNAVCDDGSCTTSILDPGTCNTDCTLGDIEVWNSSTCLCEINISVVPGCTDSNYCEYTANANCDDGTCLTSIQDPGTCNTDCTLGSTEVWNPVSCQCELNA